MNGAAVRGGYRTLHFEKRGAADWLTLNRPERLNAFNATMVDELADYFGRLMRDSSVRVVVLRGAGRAFCAGVDVKEIHSLVANGTVSDWAGQRRVSELIVAMRRCPQPILALVHGAATGGGFALALAADIRLAGESARMNCAFIKLGLTSCDMGLSWFLPRLVGPSNAGADVHRPLRRRPPRRRHEPRQRVPPRRGTGSRRRNLCRRHAGGRPAGLAPHQGRPRPGACPASLEAAIAVEDRNQVLTLNAPDFREGLAAFYEKRPPRWPD